MKKPKRHIVSVYGRNKLMTIEQIKQACCDMSWTIEYVEERLAYFEERLAYWKDQEMKTRAELNYTNHNRAGYMHPAEAKELKIRVLNLQEANNILKASIKDLPQVL